MPRSTILLIDAIFSLVLGAFLVAFPKPLAEWIGIPMASSRFYPSLLGVVVIGIAIALVMEWKCAANECVGLGVGGAVAIDLSAAFALAGWLLLGGLGLPLRGQALLWFLVGLLILVSGLGLFANRKSQSR